MATRPSTATRATGRRTALCVGERVFLRRPTASDCEEYCRIRRESAALHRPWEPEPAEGVDPYGEEAFAAFLRTSRRRDQERLLICSLDDGRLVGNVNLSHIIHGVLQSAFVGYWVALAAEGRGYMTEGLMLLLEHGFLHLELHRLEANIQPANARSIALVRRCGFRKEGFSPRYLKIAGEWRDHERWAILSDEWCAARANPDRPPTAGARGARPRRPFRGRSRRGS